MNALSTQRAIVTVVVFVATFFVTLTLGRLLKRRAGVRLGVLYQLFCLTLAFYAAIMAYGSRADYSRHVTVLLLLLGTAFLLAVLDRYLWDLYFEQRRQTPIPKFLRHAVALAIFLFVLLIVLSRVYHAEAELRGLLAGSGIAAIVLAFAMQNLLGGMISGISLQVSRPFRVGDWLQIGDRYGEVVEMNLDSTRLRTNDAISLDIPNNEIVRQTIVNLHYPTPLHAMRLRIGIDYNTPPNKVKDALFRATVNAEGVLPEPKPKIYLMDFADSAVTYEIKFWMNSHAAFNDIADAIRTNIWYELKRQEISIPYPIRTLQLQRKTPHAATDARDEARAILRNEPLFQCLTDDQLNRIVDEADVKHFGRGERIIEEGADGDSMFILLRGSAQVAIANTTSAVRVGVLRTGDCFGEMSLLTGERRMATVRADGDCEVLEITKPTMSDIFHETPECLEQLSALLARRRMENEGIIRDATQPHDGKEQEYRTSFLGRLKAVFEL